MTQDIAGCYPMGCGRTLFLGAGGYITCSRIECPRPTAATDLLVDSETEHVVEFTQNAFTVRHPLRECLGDALMDCELHDHIADLAGPPVQPGQYRAHKVLGGRRWTWERLPEPEGAKP